MTKRIMVIGAYGDVGQGLVEAAVSRGWSVAASGRDSAKLEKIVARHPAGAVKAVAGSLADADQSTRLVEHARDILGGIDAVIVSVNAPNVSRRLLDWDTSDLENVLRGNLLTHFNAAKAALPLLAPDGVLMGIGGGTADFVRAERAQISIAQAGLRMMYRGLAKENRTPLIRQLQIVSMVNGESTRAEAEESWLTDVEIGHHACAIIDCPSNYPGPIVILKSRAQVGQPDSPVQ